MYVKNFRNKSNKKNINKMTKYWTTVSIALLGIIGGNALTANANTANSSNQQNNNYQLHSANSTSNRAKATLINNDINSGSFSNNASNASEERSQNIFSNASNDNIYMRILQNHITTKSQNSTTDNSNFTSSNNVNNEINNSSDNDFNINSFNFDESSSQSSLTTHLISQMNYNTSKASSAVKNANVENSADINDLNKKQVSLFKSVSNSVHEPTMKKVSNSKDSVATDNDRSHSNSTDNLNLNSIHKNNFSYHPNSINMNDNTERNPEANNINPIIFEDDDHRDSDVSDRSTQFSNNYGEVNQFDHPNSKDFASNIQNSLISKRLNKLSNNVNLLSGTVNTLSITVKNMLKNFQNRIDK